MYSTILIVLYIYTVMNIKRYHGCTGVNEIWLQLFKLGMFAYTSSVAVIFIKIISTTHPQNNNFEISYPMRIHTLGPHIPS